MAYRIANSNTTLTSTTGWDTVTNTPTIHASTNLTFTPPIYSAGYTAPNTTNKATGVAVLLVTNGMYSSGSLTFTATLQEYNGATWNDTAATATLTINTTTYNFAQNSWIYFQYGTPYTFTTTTAGYYRVKLTRSTSSNTPTFRTDSGGANFAFMATDNRTGALATTDDILILGINYADTTVTLDGTVSIGSGIGALVTPTTPATLSFGLYLGSHGIATADTAASVTTTCKGHFLTTWLSALNVGSSGTPYPSDKKFTFTFNPTANGDFGFRSFNGNIALYGSPKTSTTLWKTTYSSGVGTAANPLILTNSVDWSVGDEIAVLASSDNATNYNEVEWRFIKTKNSPTSYVVSNTVGGAEAALTYTHTNAYVVNVERNILFNTTDITKAAYYGFSNSPSSFVSFPSYGAINIKWARFETTGLSNAVDPLMGVSFIGSTTFTFDYSVCYRPIFSGFWGSNNVVPTTIEGLICCRASSGASYFLYGQAMANKTFNDCFIFDGNTSYALVPYGSVNIFNRTVINGCRKASTSTGAGAIYLQLSTNNQFNDCEFNCCGLMFLYPVTSTGNVFNRCNFGTKGKNLYDFSAIQSFQTARFTDCAFNPNTFWVANNYSNFFDGSEIVFENYNTTTNNHLWYTPYGIASATGSGLSDTLVRTPGSLNVRLSPENSTNGLSWSFLIPANKNQVVPFSGYFLKNVAMGTDVCTVSLFLPGNPVTGTPDDTVTLSDDVSNTWTGSAVQAVSLAAYYTGTVDTFATVVINAKSTTAGAYLYCADFYNSGDTTTLYDKLAGLTIWYNGKPSPIITQLSLGGIAPAVWGVALSGLTTPGTTGKKLKDSLTTAKFIALK